MVIVGYGQIIPQSIIDITPLGMINVHASLLPELRGAAPIQWAIRDLYACDSYVGIIGPSAALKTFVALSQGLAVATGEEWFGRASRSGAVFYVGGEVSIGSLLVSFFKEPTIGNMIEKDAAPDWRGRMDVGLKHG